MQLFTSKKHALVLQSSVIRVTYHFGNLSLIKYRCKRDSSTEFQLEKNLNIMTVSFSFFFLLHHLTYMQSFMRQNYKNNLVFLSNLLVNIKDIENIIIKKFLANEKYYCRRGFANVEVRNRM